jgi:hypothetical protein
MSGTWYGLTSRHLDDLKDVVVPDPSDGDVLVYQDGQWVAGEVESPEPSAAVALIAEEPNWNDPFVQSAPSGSSFSRVPFGVGSSLISRNDGFGLSSGDLLVPVAGVYGAVGMIEWNDQGPLGLRGMGWVRNGGLLCSMWLSSAYPIRTMITVPMLPMECEPGDAIRMVGAQTSGAGLAVSQARCSIWRVGA